MSCGFGRVPEADGVEVLGAAVEVGAVFVVDVVDPALSSVPQPAPASTALSSATTGARANLALATSGLTDTFHTTSCRSSDRGGRLLVSVDAVAHLL